MYTDTEILSIARNCTTIEEVLHASKIFRELTMAGLMKSSKFVKFTMVKRFRELVTD